MNPKRARRSSRPDSIRQRKAAQNRAVVRISAALKRSGVPDAKLEAFERICFRKRIKTRRLKLDDLQPAIQERLLDYAAKHTLRETADWLRPTIAVSQSTLANWLERRVVVSQRPSKRSALDALPIGRQQELLEYSRRHSLKETIRWLEEAEIHISTSTLSCWLSRPANHIIPSQ